MANAAYDFCPGEYFILRIGADGPERVEGHKTYSDHGTATEAAFRYLSPNYKKDVIAVVKVKGLHKLKVMAELTDVTK